MAIPLSYNVRNLRLRKSLTIMTALGIALTVATAVFIMALLAGLGRAFCHHRRSSECADAAQGFGLGTGRGRSLARCHAGDKRPVRMLPRTAKGEPLVSGEDILVVVLAAQGRDGRNQCHYPLSDSARN